MKQPLPGRLGLFRRAIAHVTLAARLMRERQVSIGLKALMVGAAAYVIMPFDLLPDFIPGIGQLDDLTVLVLAIEAVIALAPQKLVDHHLAGIRDRRPFAQAPVGPDDTVIDAEWRRH